MFKLFGKALTFIKSAKSTNGRAGKRVRLIVIHTAETPETPKRALQVANWFAGKTSPDASAHFMVDNKTIINMVDIKNTAWACGVTAINQASVSIELAGSASQSKLDWKDPYSLAELDLAAALVAELCIQFNIPAVHLGTGLVKTGRGIIGHNDVTVAYSVKGGHSDPGKNFPWIYFIKLVNSNLNKKVGK